MDYSIIDAFKDLYRLNTVILVLVIGLYAYAIYGTIVMTRLLHDIARTTRRPEQD